MHLVVSISHESRGICVAENEHVWINLQREISGSIKASWDHTYLWLATPPRGSDACHASNKWSIQPRAATESPRLASAGEGEMPNKALPWRRILLTAWTLPLVLTIFADTRTVRGNLNVRPPRLPSDSLSHHSLIPTRNAI